MPTKLKRYSVSFPDELKLLLQADCRKNKIKVGKKLLAITTEHYQMQMNQPMYFGRSLPHADESPGSRPLVFRASGQPKSLPEVDQKISRGQE